MPLGRSHSNSMVAVMCSVLLKFCELFQAGLERVSYTASSSKPPAASVSVEIRLLFAREGDLARECTNCIRMWWN